MAISDDTLHAYLNKMLNRQSEARDRPFSPEELKQMAMDMGITEADWLASQQEAEDYFRTGEGHLLRQNWQDAIQVLEKSVALNPHHPQAAYALAKAHQEHWTSTRQIQDKQQALKFAELALSLHPAHSPTLQLLAELRQTEVHIRKNQQWRQGLAIGATAILMLMLGWWYVSVQNYATRLREQVYKSWADVEDVYQRRNDLIPKIVQAAKTEADFEQAILKQVLQARSDASQVKVNITTQNDRQFADFEKQQEELAKALNTMLDKSNGYTKLRASQQFQDLQAQIEGSQNRINIARRKYNQAVQEYNTFVKTFPNRLLGYEAMEYFKDKK